MQRAKAIDGVEWAAADMTFTQDGLETAIKKRTLWLSGTPGGVITGGVVGNGGGLTITITAPLKFLVNGEYGELSSIANKSVVNGTNYVVAKYSTVDDTVATYYGTGGAPYLHRNDLVEVLVRTSGPADSNAGEVDLATVTAAAGTITLITATRNVLPSTDNAGNLLLGSGKTIDGVDPSVHVATVATTGVLGHVLLGAAGGAARFEDVPAAAKYWLVNLYVKSRSSGFIPDDSDFDTPPGGITVTTWRDLTFDGSHMREGDGPEYNWRLTLAFTSSAAFSGAARVLTTDDTIRVKMNGSTIYSHAGGNLDLNTAVTLPVLLGANTLKLFFCNGGGAQWRNSFFTSLLTDNRITFNPL